ncbi:MAG: hypothetical protein C3F11_03905 [Methylocystaceae bacterium]|nr:MAG: hypothetical protein C3F11_03905 [Methylocystaceae bacterium]
MTETAMNPADPILQVAGRGPVPASLKRFVWDIQSMVELADSEREILVIGRDLMARLVSSDDWLPAVFAAPSPGGGRQFQLYADGLERFSIVSTILWDGAALSVAQPSVWEIMGVLRGAMTRRGLDCSGDGCAQPRGEGPLLQPGAVDAHASGSGDILRLSNALADGISIGVHVYGGEIGRLSRRSLAPDGRMGEQPLGYANAENAPPYDIWSIQTVIRD